METLIFVFLTAVVIAIIAIAWDNKMNKDPNKDEDLEDEEY